ncbi:MAG TPA: UbiA-like polyprenyltransferase [Candidatus Gastranaerophilales bacterium]|nr:UbiA-like polyprenyltransferase [Candidatus Gastranaerophilales bacterium]
MNAIISKISEYIELIKFEHTIFALPFALSGMLLANTQALPEIYAVFWVLLAMVGGRTAAMALNRVIDADIDKKNPRTSDRAIPAGKIKKTSALTLALLSFCALIFAAWQLPLICRQLLPLAILILALYSYTKRFTHLSHFVLGGALGAAATGGWLAISGEITVPSVLWGFAIVFWVAGFDVIYAIQDIDFDRKHNLFSIPAWLGINKSLILSRIFHVFTLTFLLILGIIMKTGLYYWLGVIFTLFALIYEHSLLKANDLSGLNKAFFNVNGYISIGMFLFILLDTIFRIKIF